MNVIEQKEKLSAKLLRYLPDLGTFHSLSKAPARMAAPFASLPSANV